MHGIFFENVSANYVKKTQVYKIYVNEKVAVNNKQMSV